MFVEGSVVLSQITELVVYEELKGGSARIASTIKFESRAGSVDLALRFEERNGYQASLVGLSVSFLL
jgi:hypothetical protein